MILILSTDSASVLEPACIELLSGRFIVELRESRASNNRLRADHKPLNNQPVGCCQRQIVLKVKAFGNVDCDDKEVHFCTF